MKKISVPQSLSPPHRTTQLLFVCSGNICRSPMAELLARTLLNESGQTRVSIQSAGTLNIDGAPASKTAVQIMAETGHDLRTHRSQRLGARRLEEADWIVVMAPEHVEAIVSVAPGVAEKIVRLWDYSSQGRAWGLIPDPIGRAPDVYRLCRDLIQEGVANWLQELGLLPLSTPSSSA